MQFHYPSGYCPILRGTFLLILYIQSVLKGLTEASSQEINDKLPFVISSSDEVRYLKSFPLPRSFQSTSSAFQGDHKKSHHRLRRKTGSISYTWRCRAMAFILYSLRRSIILSLTYCCHSNQTISIGSFSVHLLLERRNSAREKTGQRCIFFFMSQACQVKVFDQC